MIVISMLSVEIRMEHLTVSVTLASWEVEVKATAVSVSGY